MMACWDLKDVRAKNYVYLTFAPKREGLINVRKIHCQERAGPRFDPAQHQYGIGQVVNFQVRTTCAAASHRQLVGRQPEIACRVKVDHGTSRTGIDQDDNGMSIDRARGVEVPQTTL